MDTSDGDTGTYKDGDKPPVADSCADPFEDEVIDMGTLRIH